MSRHTTLFIPAVAGALALLCACTASFNQPPAQIVDMSKPLVVRVESEPGGAEVHEVGVDGRAVSLLGTTPLNWEPYQIGKQIWKFDPESDFVERHSARGADVEEQHLLVTNESDSWTASQGNAVCLDLLLTLEGFENARIVRCIAPDELPSVWRGPPVRMHATLIRAEEE